MNSQDLKQYIHTVVDFPEPGIRFRDITPLLADPRAFDASIELMAECMSPYSIDAIAAVEARGFIFGAALANKLGLPFHPVRKAGKLPRATARIDYQLEYGADSLEIHADAVGNGAKFAIVDDVLATGGTAAAVAKLLHGAGSEITCCAFLLELDGLPGRRLLQPHPVEALLKYTLAE